MLKVSLLTLLGIITACAQTQTKDWIYESDFKNPESVYYNPSDDYIYISNINGGGMEKNAKGYISKVSLSGRIIDKKWVTGLNAPKGSRAHDGILWVSDIDEVVTIDMKEAEIQKRYKIKGAKFLNDIAITKEGTVFVSDTLGSKIYKIEDEKVSIFMEGKSLDSPNGLLILGPKMYVASWGFTKDWSTKKGGHLYSINLATKKISSMTKPLGNLDGIELDENGNFLVSDYVGGQIFLINKVSGNSKVIYTGKRSLADIGYIAPRRQILIPYLESNKVLATIIQNNQ